MRHLKRPGSDWSLFLRAYPLVLFIRVALWIRPFPKVYEWVSNYRKGRVGDRPLDNRAVSKIVWAVSAASRRVPKATCLTQALATQIMLGRRGHRTTLQIGVQKPENGGLDAHAWIERDGRVLIGFNDNFDALVRLPPLQSEQQ